MYALIFPQIPPITPQSNLLTANRNPKSLRRTIPSPALPLRRTIIQSPPLCFIDDEPQIHGFPLNPNFTFTPPNLFLNAYGGGASTLQPSKPNLDLSKKAPSKDSNLPELDEGNGTNNGDNGKVNDSGKGGGANDDDDYTFGDFDDDENGDENGIFRRRVLVAELFDKETMKAVLSEWMKTMKDLPMDLKQACEMGIVSSSKITKFLLLNSRSTLTRSLIRAFPRRLSIDFQAKLMADPSLTYKLVWEGLCSLGWSIWLEKDRIKEEWHLVLANGLVNSACNLFVVWSLAPSFDGSIYLKRKLPNNVFEKSQKFQVFDMRKRLISFLYKTTCLFALGFGAKVAQFGLAKRGEKVRNRLASLGKEAFVGGISLGLFLNIRHQILCGIEKELYLYFDAIKVSIAFGLALRFLNARVGSHSLSWVCDGEQSLLPQSFASSFDWLDLNNTIGSENVKRKRVIRRKMTATL
ncbi:hypothetical protein UlMin_009191 [Ulmus minor]